MMGQLSFNKTFVVFIAHVGADFSSKGAAVNDSVKVHRLWSDSRRVRITPHFGNV